MKDDFRFPAEWEPHRAVWLAWPSHGDLWGPALAGVQVEFVELCRAIADPDPDTGKPRGEALSILIPDESHRDLAENSLAALGATISCAAFGDIWLRDTGPLFLKDGPRTIASRYRFNGWGGKYVLPHDDTVGEAIAGLTDPDQLLVHDWVLEGGSIEVDGIGNLLTTEECLLNKNRNPGMNREDIETRLVRELGVKKVHWLERGLIGDHTDGHIDNIARFVGEAKVLCMEPLGPTDPNREVLETVQQDLLKLHTLDGNPLELITLPSAGRVLSSDGELMAASHVNFYIGNRTVVVPLYPESREADVLAILRDCFPNRRVVGCQAWHLLHGGGSFHCITQQVPA